MSDPEIEALDVTAHAGMEYYAFDSAARLAPWFRRMAAEAVSEAEEEERWPIPQ